MKLKAILSFAILAAAVGASAAPYSATGAGTSTVGTLGGEDYSSLALAVGAANAALTRDASAWTFSITSDLSEPTNSFLGVTVDPAGSIVFKPAVGTAPTITFTKTTDNAGVSGSFVIGQNTDVTPSSLTNPGTKPTRNVTIDGSNTVAGTTRDLTITNTSSVTFAASSIIALYGDCDGFTLKNTNVVNVNPAVVGSCSAISIRPRYDAAAAGIPENWTLDNNLLRSTTSQQGVAIQVNSNGAVVVGLLAPAGYLIQNNDLEGRIRGIFANPLAAGTITKNRFKVGATGTTNSFDSFGIIWNGINSMTNQTINITKNDLEVYGDNQNQNLGPTGLFIGSITGTGNIANIISNEITVAHNIVGLNPGAGYVGKTRAIFGSSLIAYNIYNNSCKITANYTGTQSAAQSYGIGGYSTTTTPDARNNVVSISVPGGAAGNQNGIPGTFTSDFNILHASNGANIYARQAIPAAFTFHNRSVSSGVATISTGSGTTAQAHTLVVGDQVVLAPTLTVNFHNRSISSGTATILTGAGTTAAAHTFAVGDKVYLNHTTQTTNPTGPRAAYDGLRTITATTASSFSFATAGADEAALGTAATQGTAIKFFAGASGGPFTITAVPTTASFQYAVSDPDLTALVTAATQGNYYKVGGTGVNYSNLAAWQAVGVTSDPNSDELDPNGFWTSATNLHLTGVPGDAGTWGGAVIGAVTDDVDGDARHNPNPYRGSDELAPALANAGISDWSVLDQ